MTADAKVILAAAGSPLIQGCSFICVAPIILIGSHYGIPALYGSVISCGLFTILVGPWFSRMLRFFPPVVIGSVITVIGLSLLPVAGDWLGGGDPAAADFGSLVHLTLGLSTMVLIVLLQRYGHGMMANLSVLPGLIGGTVLAASAGPASFRRVPATPWFAMAHPLLFGPPHFVLLPALVMSLSMINTSTKFILVTEASMAIAATNDSSRPLPTQSSCLCDRMYKRSGSDISVSLLA